MGQGEETSNLLLEGRLLTEIEPPGFGDAAAVSFLMLMGIVPVVALYWFIARKRRIL